MKKVLSRAFVLAMAAVLAFALVGCSSGTTAPAEDAAASAVVGTWAGELDGIQITYVFNEDGTGSMAVDNDEANLLPFTYTVTDAAFTITVLADEEQGVMEYTEDYAYTLDGDTLTFTDGPLVMQRQ